MQGVWYTFVNFGAKKNPHRPAREPHLPCNPKNSGGPGYYYHSERRHSKTALLGVSLGLRDFCGARFWGYYHAKRFNREAALRVELAANAVRQPLHAFHYLMPCVRMGERQIRSPLCYGFKRFPSPDAVMSVEGIPVFCRRRTVHS